MLPAKKSFFHPDFCLTYNISYLNVSNIRQRTVLHERCILLTFATAIQRTQFINALITLNHEKGRKVASGANFAAVTVGKTEELNQYALPLAPGVEIPGKVFVGGDLQATGAEMSFQQFAPGGSVGFLHTHKTHEELYIILGGDGEFQVDGQVFPVGEGSVIRVSPAGRRSLRNTGDSPMTMICIQYKAASFDAGDAADGEILPDQVVW